MTAPAGDAAPVVAPETGAIEAVARELGALVVRDVPLAPQTTYRVGGAAALFATPATVDELMRIGEVAAAHGVAVLVVGRGSNLLVADEGFRGLAVSLTELGGDIDVGERSVLAGSAVALPVLARRVAAMGRSGIEWMVGVPGSVGGAVRMNAGGHGSDVAECLVEADVLDLRLGRRRLVGPESLGLRFRGSAMADHQVVLTARFRVEPAERENVERELAEIVRWRREHQPGGQNAGSVFVNPIPGQLSAGEVIDGLGLRGFRIGSAHVSEKHANFIQADEHGCAADVRAVMEAVRTRVLVATGMLLRSEIRLVGFGDGEPPSSGIDL